MLNADIVAIEVKRTDWRRAVLQAMLNRYCADRSFIALWASQLTDDVIEEARHSGVGVLSISVAALRMLSTAPLSAPDPEIRMRLRAQLDVDRESEPK